MEVATKKEDRRVRRTKKLLTQALTELMQQKQIKDITVTELTEKADAVFYALRDCRSCFQWPVRQKRRSRRFRLFPALPAKQRPRYCDLVEKDRKKLRFNLIGNSSHPLQC